MDSDPLPDYLNKKVNNKINNKMRAIATNRFDMWLF